MKKRLLFLLLPLVFFVTSNTQAGNVDVGVNLNIGVPNIRIESPPEFLLIPSLGMHISIGAPYDIFYLDGFYFYFDNNRWYRSSNYQGPWGYVDRRHLPKQMRNHDHREMLDWRDREYREYNKNREKHRDRSFRPDDRHDGGKEGHGNKGGHGRK